MNIKDKYASVRWQIRWTCWWRLWPSYSKYESDLDGYFPRQCWFCFSVFQMYWYE